MLHPLWEATPLTSTLGLVGCGLCLNTHSFVHKEWQRLRGLMLTLQLKSQSDPVHLP